MRILLTNDDGYGAAGLNALIKHLSLDNEVYVCAPAHNKSGASHSINLADHLEIVEKGPNSFTCDGTPADCVITAMRSNLFSEKIDVVISGINKGANIGTDIIYSGTCGAARQAVLHGIPGIAMSLSLDNNPELWNDDSAFKYDALADFAAKNLKTLMSLCRVAEKNACMPKEPCVFVNLNAYSKDSYTDAKFTDISFREYVSDKVTLEKYDNTTRRVFCYGQSDTKSRAYSDYDAVTDGFISVSRVYAEAVSAGAMDGISFSL